MQLIRRSLNVSPDPLDSKLYDEKTFCPAFIKDLNNCGSELVIEYPFTTTFSSVQKYLHDVEEALHSFFPC